MEGSAAGKSNISFSLQPSDFMYFLPFLPFFYTLKLFKGCLVGLQHMELLISISFMEVCVCGREKTAVQMCFSCHPSDAWTDAVAWCQVSGLIVSAGIRLSAKPNHVHK